MRLATSAPMAVAPMATRSSLPSSRRIRASSKIASICASSSRTRIAAGSAGAGEDAAGGEFAQRLRDAVRIDQRDRGAAVRAGGLRWRDRSARRIASTRPAVRSRGASRARRRRRPDEILLAQKVVERDELPVIVAAPPVREASRALQILGERKRRRADRARELGRERVARLSGPADVLEDLEHRPRRQPDALRLVEPEQVARRARRDLDGAQRAVRLQHERGHRLTAIRAIGHARILRACEEMVPVEGVEPSTFALRSAFIPTYSFVNHTLAALAHLKSHVIQSQLRHSKPGLDTTLAQLKPNMRRRARCTRSRKRSPMTARLPIQPPCADASLGLDRQSRCR